jgi:hypothetical protein
MNTQLRPIDHSAIRASQVTLILLLVAAFVLNQPWLVFLAALALLAGVLAGRPAFGFVYTTILRPLGWMKPEVILDNPEPHRFAQALGSAFLAAGSLALAAGVAPLGWALSWLVAGLAALNAFAGFCAGCAVYYWLNRRNVPGFAKAPPPEVFPGRPPRGQR